MWLWRLMYGSAILASAIVVVTLLLFLWFMVDVGFAWASVVVLALVAWLLFSAVRSRSRHAGFDIRR